MPGVLETQGGDVTDSHCVRRVSVRTVAIVVALALTLLLGGQLTGSASAAPPTLNYACVPAPPNCQGWYRSAVTLSWDWNQLIAEPSAGDCTPGPFVADTRGTETWCEVRDKVTLEKTRHALVIHIDKTPPSVAAVPARPPDYGGWFNHPVSVAFTGSDATSGLRGCSSTTYAGPDRPGVRVPGICTDVAGNVGTGSFALNYDATPPPAPFVDALPGDNKIALEWSTSPDSQAEVVRDPRGDAPPVVVYRGPAGAFTDRGLKNGQRYRYLVTLIDQAGNRAPGTASAVPTSSKLLLPAKGERIRLVEVPLLVWKRARRADYYNVQVFRGRTKVLSAWPRRTQLQLRRRWRFGGHEYRLRPARYCWYVWPGFGKRSKRDYGKRLGSSCFRVLRPRA